ncbi:hypothetical protein GQ457_07G024470 [Hibiscus cannabinus]
MEVASLIVSPLLQVMYDKLSSYLNGVETPKVQKKIIQKLQDKLLTIQAVIEDAEEKQLRDKTVRIWLSKLADAAYDADDLLDEISTRALLRQTLRKRVPSEPSSWKWKDPVKDQLRRIRSSVGKETRRQVRITSFTLQSILTEFEMRRKLTDIIERLEDIAREMSTFSFKQVVVYKRSDTREKRETGPSVDASQILGRTEDRKKIVDLLLSSGADTWVIPIVGIGGIGKTTLAQVVYNDPNLDGHFDKKIWVSLYDNFSTKKLLTEILECLAERRCESSHMGVLQSQLRDLLYGKRYLLVMDDVWSDDQEEWDKVRNLLRCGAEGSKIIVTTRSEKVASLMSNSTTYHVLKALTKDDCWTLFKQQAFAYGSEGVPIGLRIIDKCQGVPLAAKVLGGLLRFRRMEDEWLRVQESALWNLDAETIGHLCNLRTLDLSGCTDLLELPGEIVNLVNLIHLNIKDCARLASLPFIVSADFFWLDRKRIQTLPRFIASNYNLRLLHLFDLRGELKITHLENAFPYFEDPPLLHSQLHTLELFWGGGDEGKLNRTTSREARQTEAYSERLIKGLQPSPSIRRLSINGYPGRQLPPWMNPDAISNLTVLKLINCRNVETLSMFGQLPILKCLNIQGMGNVVKIDNEFTGGGMKPFPSLNELTLGDIPELRTWENTGSAEAFPCLKRLSIIKCALLKTMPWFPTIQHLILKDCDPLLLRSAADLRTLLTLVIESFLELAFIPKVLVENCLLLVSLTVISCPKLHTLPINLGRVTALKSLKIAWCEMLDSLPHGLADLISLENLEIIECPTLITLPEKSLERLSSLRSLSIENCNGFTSFPEGMQHATALERLTVMYCSNLVSLPDGLHNLLVLKSLTIISCPELASLPEGVQHMKMLQNLEIRICPKLTTLPEVKNLISLRSLAISDCQNVKSLPEGIEQLSELQHLSVQDCPELENRCKREDKTLQPAPQVHRIGKLTSIDHNIWSWRFPIVSDCSYRRCQDHSFDTRGIST